MIRKKLDKFSFSNITPDEIFLDSKNIPGFDRHQMEGRVEKPIKTDVFFALGLIFIFMGGVLLFKTGYLQIVKGSIFAQYAVTNHLKVEMIYPERGLIYDRDGKLLAWNDSVFSLVLPKSVFENEVFSDELNEFFKTVSFERFDRTQINQIESENVLVAIFEEWEDVNRVYKEWNNLPLQIRPIYLRDYVQTEGLAHVLGYVGLPSLEDISNNPEISLNNILGKGGVEKSYENVLRGVLGSRLIEKGPDGETKSEFLKQAPVPGESITLTIDSEIQNQLFQIIRALCQERGFHGAAAIVMDVKNGDVLSLANYPEYNSSVLTKGAPAELIESYLKNNDKPFLNRGVSGLYAPGSVVKPFVALGALNEKTIDPKKQIFSSGSISLPNPYFPDQFSVFYDWKAHGWVDMRRALAVSSNVYFYSIGGGFEDVKGLGIDRLKGYFEMFGLGMETGIDLPGEEKGLVPDPKTKEANSNDTIWRVGDTYNVSIGQGGFQVTPVQMAVAAAAVANDGYIVMPRLTFKKKEEKNVISKEIPEEYFQIVKEGMRSVVLGGTAQALSGLPIKIAAKTGTAELGSGKFVNSWLTAFWPYENPQYIITIVFEKGDSKNLVGSVSAGLQFFEWMVVHKPKYLQAQ